MTWLPGALFFALLGFSTAVLSALVVVVIVVGWAVKAVRRVADRVWAWRYGFRQPALLPKRIPAPPTMPSRPDLEAALRSRTRHPSHTVPAPAAEPSPADIEHILTTAIRATREAATNR